jgi:hypothetical protein
MHDLELGVGEAVPARFSPRVADKRIETVAQ